MPNKVGPAKTIGIVLPYLKSRGTEKQALRLASGFKSRGAGVVLFVVQGWGAPQMYRAFLEAGVKVVNVGPPLDEGQKSVRFNRMWPLARLVRKHGCTALLSRANMTNKIAGYAGRLAFVETAVVLSSAVRKKEPSAIPLKRWISTLRSAGALGFPWRIISVSKEGAENFGHSYPPLRDRVVSIPNGIDQPEVSCRATGAELDPQGFYFCYSGSLEISRKGLDVLISAFGLAVREYGLEQSRLLLIGTGEDEGRIKALVKNERLRELVVFAGEQDDPRALMAQCGAFVLASRKEGFPNAILEAMSLGLCVLSSDCDTGPREIITHGKDGLLVDVEDTRALASAMAQVVNNEPMRRSLGEQAKQTVMTRFSSDKMVDAYYEILVGAK